MFFCVFHGDSSPDATSKIMLEPIPHFSHCCVFSHVSELTQTFHLKSDCLDLCSLVTALDITLWYHCSCLMTCTTFLMLPWVFALSDHLCWCLYPRSPVAASCFRPGSCWACPAPLLLSGMLIFWCHSLHLACPGATHVSCRELSPCCLNLGMAIETMLRVHQRKNLFPLLAGLLHT